MTVVLRVVPTRTPIISGCQLNFLVDHNSEPADFPPTLLPTCHKFWDTTTTRGVPKGAQAHNLWWSPLVHSSRELIIKINEVHQPEIALDNSMFISPHDLHVFRVFKNSCSKDLLHSFPKEQSELPGSSFLPFLKNKSSWTLPIDVGKEFVMFCL